MVVSVLLFQQFSFELWSLCVLRWTTLVSYLSKKCSFLMFNFSCISLLRERSVGWETNGSSPRYHEGRVEEAFLKYALFLIGIRVAQSNAAFILDRRKLGSLFLHSLKFFKSVILYSHPALIIVSYVQYSSLIWWLFDH